MQKFIVSSKQIGADDFCANESGCVIDVPGSAGRRGTRPCLHFHFLLKMKIKVSPGPYPASKAPPEPCI